MQSRHQPDLYEALAVQPYLDGPTPCEQCEVHQATITFDFDPNEAPMDLCGLCVLAMLLEAEMVREAAKN